MAEQDYDVVVVGGGPVGVGLAIELGQRGVRTALVERRRTPQRIPKGQNLTNRTLEHFYFWRCADELRAAQLLPPDFPAGGITAYGNLMSPFFYSSEWAGRGPGVQDYYFERNARIPQYLTEEVLRNRLAQVPSVAAYFGWTASEVAVDDTGVRVTMAPTGDASDPTYSWWGSTGQPDEPRPAQADGRQTLRARYVVGCDGGRSLVRETMGIDRGGQDFDQRMVLAVFRSRELHEALKRFPECSTYRVLKPELEGYWQFFGRVDPDESFFFHAPVPPSTTPETFDALGLLREAAGVPFHAEMDYVGFWDLRIMVASQYRAGRVFIAGDACHQHPPYGGFGLNTGLEDARNLGWKLAAALQGWGGEALLDSYGAERRPVFVETGDTAIAGGIEEDRLFLARYSPERDPAEFAQAWQEMARSSGFASGRYNPYYACSPVVTGPPDGACGIFGELTLAAQPGYHLAPRTLSGGRNVYAELGDGFTLLALDADSRPLVAAATTLGVPLKVIQDSQAEGREQYAAKLVLVRPDQYVAWAGDAPPADAAGLLRQVAGLP